MKQIPTFNGFVNESIVQSKEFSIGTPGTFMAKGTVSPSPGDIKTKALRFSIELDVQVSEELKKRVGIVKQDFVLAMSKDSTGVYSIGEDIEKYMGIPEADVIRDVADGKDTPNGAVIYGMCNLMNGGKEMYFWTNGTRLRGEAEKTSTLSAVLEQVSHECIHLTRLILCRAIAKKMGAKMDADWAGFDFGGGEWVWPAIGEPSDKDPIVMIDEEGFATAVGGIVQIISPYFIELASEYLPELKNM